MRTEKMIEVCRTLKEYGCRSFHIGGGEPFIDFESLLTLAKIARETGIIIEYVETNAYWVRAMDDEDVLRKLSALQSVGIDALCISADEYHAEFIDPALPLKLAEICRKVGFEHFLWQTQLNRLRFNGRAITLQKDFPRRPVQELLTYHADGCRGLTSVGHFHVDLHGRYIPPGCTGIVLPLEEVLNGTLDVRSANWPGGHRAMAADSRFVAFNALYSGGVSALYALAKERGFVEDSEGYPAPCTLCFYIRAFLSELPDFPELDAAHYKHALEDVYNFSNNRILKKS